MRVSVFKIQTRVCKKKIKENNNKRKEKAKERRRWEIVVFE